MICLAICEKVGLKNWKLEVWLFCLGMEHWTECVFGLEGCYWIREKLGKISRMKVGEDSVIRFCVKDRWPSVLRRL